MKTKLLFLSIMLLASACSQGSDLSSPISPSRPSPTNTPTIILASQFIPSDCRFEPMGDAKPQCGDILVPEDRSQNSGQKLKLHFAIYRCTGSDCQKDPVLILFNSPSATLSWTGWLPYEFEKINAKRDLIVFDQRGVGLSEPAMDCPEVTEGFYKLLEQPIDKKQIPQRIADTHQRCHDRLASSGVNLASYSTTDTAADIEELRQSLGIKQWNIYAFGSGSRPALDILRDYPQTVRSAILDSVIPPQVDVLASQATNAQRVLDVTFQACTDDQACRTAYPNSKALFYELVDRLNGNPITVEVKDLEHGKRYNVIVDGDRLIDVALMAVDLVSVGELPRMLYHARDGKYDVLSNYLATYSGYFAPSDAGIQALVGCLEQYSFSSPEKFTAETEKLTPQIGEYFKNQFKINSEICKVWQVRKPSSLDHEAIKSDVPTLMFAGEMAYGIPASWQEEAKKTLSHTYAYEFNNAGSIVLSNDAWRSCANVDMATAFIENPMSEPDAMCSQAKKKILWITFQ